VFVRFRHRFGNPATKGWRLFLICEGIISTSVGSGFEVQVIEPFARSATG
jgi:hypothetical protein